MSRQRVFLTGATGTMGFMGMEALLTDPDIDLVVLARPSEKNRTKLAPYAGRITIIWGDLTHYPDVCQAVKDADLVLHVGAFVSPAADYHPKQAMEINYGSTIHLIQAIRELGQAEMTKLVYIGTVAETGDRMPPIHWGRVGDPLKPSVFDYYAVSKIAAERAVIDSGLPYWVSLRQTGIMGPAMAAVEDAIMFHNCLNNVLEYVSDRDSARLLLHLCQKERGGELKEQFWGHIFNIGGGKSCRVSTYEMYKAMFGAIGLTRLEYAADSKWYATRNFHGQYYLDSDKLQDILQFRQDGMPYFYEAYLKNMGSTASVAKLLTKLPGGQKLMGSAMRKRFEKLARTEHGTLHFLEDHMEGHIAAYWGSEEAWKAIPSFKDFQPYTDWDTVIHIDHGYDETKPEEKLDLNDVKGVDL